MCDRCHEIDARVMRARRLADGLHDRSMLRYLNGVILDLEAEKAALHSRSPKSAKPQQRN
jgi:hypothetical protein